MSKLSLGEDGINMNIYKKAGSRIYMARITRGYTREKLAELADITPKFLYEIETGRKGFSAVVLYNICMALKVSCDFIMTGNEKVGYDKALNEVLELFSAQHTEYIANILKEIHKMM